MSENNCTLNITLQYLGWRKLHNKELYVLYSSPNIILVIKSRRHRWAGYVARIGNRRGAYTVLVGNLRVGDHLEDPSIDERIILKRILQKWDGGTDWIDLAQGRDKWRDLVNAAMNLHIPQYTGNLTS